MSEPQEQHTTPPEQLKWGDSLDLLSDRTQAGTVPMALGREARAGYRRAHRAVSSCEVFWLAVCAHAGADGDITSSEQGIRQAIDDHTYIFVAFPTLSLQNADLSGAQLQNAILRDAQLERAYLKGAQLERADLRQASLDKKTNLDGAVLIDVRLDG